MSKNFKRLPESQTSCMSASCALYAVFGIFPKSRYRQTCWVNSIQYHTLIEPKTLFGHVEEPHAHSGKPLHQANELSTTKITQTHPRNTNEKQNFTR